MLVLSRKTDQAVVIGDSIIVRVIRIEGDRVRLGFDVPQEIPVHREEVKERIRAEENPPELND